jgi:hypothetical protein
VPAAAAGTHNAERMPRSGGFPAYGARHARHNCAGHLDTNQMRPWVYTHIVEGAKSEIQVKNERACGWFR